MEVVYFTLVAIALYVVAGWIVDRIERFRGARLESRSVVFFFVLLALALATFAVLRRLLEG